MKFRILSLALLLAAGIGGFVVFQQMRASAEDTPKPVEMVVKNMTGETVKLSSFRGKVVVLDVWATWCGYCVREIPDLIAFQKEMDEQKLPVQLVGASVDSNVNAVKAYLKKQPISYPIVLANAKALKPFGDIPGIPMKFIIDDKGVIVDKIVGAVDMETLKKTVTTYLPEQK